MQNFIVLGIVPGTNLQITFTFWLFAAAALMALLVARYAWRQRKHVRVYLVAIQLSRFIDRYRIAA